MNNINALHAKICMMRIPDCMYFVVYLIVLSGIFTNTYVQYFLLVNSVKDHV